MDVFSRILPISVNDGVCQGMSIFGKMSVGVRRMTAGLSKRIRIARTTNVYGRSRASLTIHMDVSLLRYGVHWKIRRNRASLHFLPEFSAIDGLHLHETEIHKDDLATARNL